MAVTPVGRGGSEQSMSALTTAPPRPAGAQATRWEPSSPPRLLLVVNPKATAVSSRLKNLVMYALRGRYELDFVETEGPGYDLILCAPYLFGVSFWADSGLIAAAGIPTVLYGPIGEGAHADVEWVDLDSLERVRDVVLRTAVEWCGRCEVEHCEHEVDHRDPHDRGNQEVRQRQRGARPGARKAAETCAMQNQSDSIQSVSPVGIRALRRGDGSEISRCADAGAVCCHGAQDARRRYRRGVRPARRTSAG